MYSNVISTNLDGLKQEDTDLKFKYNHLCIEQGKLQPELDENFISKIIGFLEKLIEFRNGNVDFRQEFYWVSSSYRMWFHYLLDRGILLDLPSTMPTPKSKLKSYQKE